MSNRIRCIKKDDRKNAYERITHIGGQNTQGKNWTLSQEDAIKAIENNTYSFYVNVEGDKVNVIVSKSRFGNKYIKTVSDGDEPNNLLSLPQCS